MRATYKPRDGNDPDLGDDAIREYVRQALTEIGPKVDELSSELIKACPNLSASTDSSRRSILGYIPKALEAYSMPCDEQ